MLPTEYNNPYYQGIVDSIHDFPSCVKNGALVGAGLTIIYESSAQKVNGAILDMQENFQMCAANSEIPSSIRNVLIGTILGGCLGAIQATINIFKAVLSSKGELF